MNRIAVAQELVKLARELTASDSAMEFVLTQRELLKLESRVDDQTWSLAIEVYKKLRDDLRLSPDQSEAINRLKNCVESSMSEADARNQIFKAAHSLGLKLPSSSF